MSQLDLIIEILKKIPERKLLIIDLASQVPIRHGSFDPDALRDIQNLVQLAVSEAREYAQHTEEAVELITRVPDKSEGPRVFNITREEFIEGISF